MPTDVVMPQMGESIAEGTIVRWIKKVGDSVDQDEPLFEISTDKVDAEIASPAAGVLTAINAKEGETVPVNSVVAVIAQAGEAAAGEAAAGAVVETPAEAVAARAAPAAAPVMSRDERRRLKSSPLVRRVAREHGVDIGQIPGTGLGGRVTKRDILSVLESGAAPAARPAAPAVPASHVPAYGPGERVKIVAMSVMRRKIAEHMVQSVHTSPHVYSIFEVNFGRAAQLIAAKKEEYAQAGAKLTYTSFIAKAVVDALRAFPIVNASVDGDKIVYKKDINLGIAVALDWGLIVPVVKSADEKNLVGLSRAIQDLAERARTKQLKPEEVQDGTFTITNPGVFGATAGLPIINQPQVGILGVGIIEKRAVVIDDAIAIRPVAYLTLGHDHRLVDGADAARFLAHVKHQIEHFDEAAV